MKDFLQKQFRPGRWSLLFMFCLLSSLPLYAQWDSDWGGNDDGYRSGNNYSSRYFIRIEDEDRNFSYGEYGELEIALEGITSYDQVEWEIDEDELPIGLELSNFNQPETLLYGHPEFTGRWCFVINATITSTTSGGQERIGKRICLQGQDNDEFEYPKFTTYRELSKGLLRQSYFKIISVELPLSSSFLTAAFHSGELPSGVDITVDNYGKKFEITGYPNTIGTSQFVLKVEDEWGQVNYKQFEIQIKERDDPTYRCPVGYYYDSTLGYCIPSTGRLCPAGRYYDPSSGLCVTYGNHPYRACRIGYYFDHFLYRCVRIGYYRCPYNYEWSSWRNRCVRLPYTCSIGQTYDWRTRSCVWWGTTNCGPNRYWDWRKNRCVRYHNSYCRSGQYYDYRRNRCVWHAHYNNCGPNRYWSPRRQKCVRNDGYKCGYGYHYNYNRGRCVPNKPGRRCGVGQHWSRRHGRCIGNRKPMPMRPMPRPRPMPGMRPPMPRPMPRPMPGMKPMPRPKPRPMPRPMPGMRPMPRPKPRPMPGMKPMPRPKPRPRPGMRPMPVPKPRPTPMHGMRPKPRPRPMPGMKPRPRPMKPRPMKP